jgi:hypothetical protein
VYVVVAGGLAVTDAPVVEDKPVAGDHEYVDAPLAVKVPEAPAQMVIGAALIAGNGLTVTVTVVVPVQPFAVVPVTVYVVVAVGFAVTVAPEVALNPVAGAHA